jgi:hypothetical protein
MRHGFYFDGVAVSRIIYIPVCDYIRLFRFLPADILSVLISLGLVWAATDILAVRGFVFRGGLVGLRC